MPSGNQSFNLNVTNDSDKKRNKSNAKLSFKLKVPEVKAKHTSHTKSMNDPSLEEQDIHVPRYTNF